MLISANSARAASTRCSAACRATAARPRSSSTATNLPPPTNISSSAARGIRPITGLKPGARTPRARNISRSGFATGRPAKDLDDLVEETDGGVVWSADASAFFYVKLDDNHRPMQVWRHRLGTKQADDVLVYEEKDSGWFTHIHESASGRFCVIAGGDHETSEQRLIDLADPEAPPRLVAAREEGVQYSVDDRGDRALHSHQRRRRHRLQDRHRAADCARARELARPDPAIAPASICSMSSFTPATWCGWSAPTRCPRSSSAISQAARNTPSRSTRRPIRSTPWAATNSTRPTCASPIRR